MDVRDYIAASAADFSRALREWLAIPSVSADPARPATCARAPGGWRATCRETGFPVVEIWETGGLPAVYAHWPSADPAAPGFSSTATMTSSPRPSATAGTTTRSRRGRRTAGSSAAAPPTTRARCSSTRSASARTWRPRLRRAAGPAHAADRGRGGVRLAQLRRAAAAAQGRAEARRDRDQRHHHVGGRCAVDLHRHARSGRRRDHAARARPATCTRARSAAACPTPRTPWPACWRGCTTPAAGSRCPASTTTCVPLNREERALFARLPFDEESWLSGRGRQPRQLRRGRLQHPGADLGAPDGRGQRPVGRAHRPGRQDDHPAGGARQALVPAGRRSGARQGHRVPQKIPRFQYSERNRDYRLRWRGGPSLSLGDRLAGCAGGPPGHAAGIRHRGALHPGGRQRPGGGPGRHPGRAAGVRGRGS